MIAQFFRLLGWLLAATFIVQMGWEEPLRYRFMDAAQIAKEEEALRPPKPVVEKKVWRPGGTSLDSSLSAPLSASRFEPASPRTDPMGRRFYQQTIPVSATPSPRWNW